MSRNYAEFVQSENLLKPKEQGIKIKLNEEPDAYDQQRARDLNNFMGMA